MKSSVKVLADYRETPFEKNVTVRCPEEYIQSQMKHLTRNHKKTETVQTTEKGDVVILSLESELEKFNRPMVPVTVGKGLFDEELEKLLIGRNVGEAFIATLQDKPVKVTVKQATRTVFPEPTDEIVKAYAAEQEELSGIQTVKEYRSHIVEGYLSEQKQQAVFRVMDNVLEYVLTGSEWEFDEREISELTAASREEVREQLSHDGKELEKLTAKELYYYFGVNSLEEFEKMLRFQSKQSIASDLWLLSVHHKNSMDEITGYPWTFLEEFAKENLNITEEK